MIIKRGDMFYADLSPVVGSEQGGIRPVLIIQNDTGNKYSPTVIAAAITSQTNKTKLPTHIEIDSEKCGLKNDSVILTEQIRTIDKSRLKEKIGHIEDINIINQINNALGVSFGLGECVIWDSKKCIIFFEVIHFLLSQMSHTFNFFIVLISSNNLLICSVSDTIVFL